MRIGRIPGFAVVTAAVLTMALGDPTAWAQDAKKAPAAAPVPPASPQAQPAAQPPAPAGSPPGWSATAVASQQGAVLEAKQIEAIKKVSEYFNAMANLKGSFVQTNAEKKRQRGKFYVKKPGRFRFDYALPSKQVIISDGKILAVQDHDLGNEDATELDNTPFRLLLRKDVDLLRDAQITEVQETDDAITLALRDKSPDSPGQIRLTLGKKPALDLKEWVTIDAQGLETKIEVSDLNKTDEIDAKLFERGSMTLKKIQ